MRDDKQDGTDKKFGKREELIQAAMGEFAEHYFDQASLNAILEKSGVGKGTFYYHFQNKEDLYLAVIDRLIHLKLEFLRERKPPQTEGGDFFSFLHSQGRLSAEFAMTDPRLEKLSLRIPHEPNSAVREMVQRKTGGKAEDYLLMLVRKAIEKGELRQDIPEEFQVKFLSFLINNFASIYQNRAGDETAAKVDILKMYDYYMDCIRNGMKGPAID